MSTDVFEYTHYRDYLLAKLGGTRQRTGIKSRLAEALHCQPSFLSQVLSGKLELSPEQGADANRFFGHSPEEANYFLQLLLYARAGSEDLRAYFSQNLEDIRKRRLLLSKRLEKSNSLTAEQRSIYYSSWHYAALHIAVTLSDLRSRESLARFFRLPAAKTNQIVEFLESAGLISNDGGRLSASSLEIFIGADSEAILRHHTNWRMQAIESLDREGPQDLHYSAVVSLSRADVIRIKKQWMKMIEEVLATIRASSEEELYSLTTDFFSLRK